MNIRIKATGIQLTPSISDYVEKRLEASAKFLESDPTAVADVEVARTSAHHKNGDVFRAEIHVVAARRDLYAAAEADDLYAAIDAMRDEILHRLSADKGRRISRIRRGGAMIKNMVKGLWRGDDPAETSS